MQRRTILFVMNPDTPDDQINDAAAAAAKGQHHLTCLILTPAPALPIYAYGVPPYGGMNIPDNWGEQLNSARKAQKIRVDAVEGILAKHGTSGDVQAVLTASMDIKHHVADRARVSDEAVFATNLHDTADVLRECAAGVLFHSPIGFHLNGTSVDGAGRIFVAWDNSEAASAAVHAALPHLKAAKDVLIGCIDPVMSATGDGEDPGTDVAAWLSHHGCNVTVSQIPSGGRAISACIQDSAREFGADLIVMGAYGHARMVQTVLGGTTRFMMEQTDLPVLFAH